MFEIIRTTLQQLNQWLDEVPQYEPLEPLLPDMVMSLYSKSNREE